MIIFVYGEDSYSAKRHLNAMMDRFQEKFDPSGMNLVQFQKKKLEVGDVMQAVQSAGFLSDKRMVVVHGLLTQVTRKPDAKPWVEQLKKIPEGTIVILFDCVSQKKVERNEIYKQLSKQKEFHNYPFPVLSGARLEAWAQRESKTLGLNIDRRMLKKVVSLVGEDLWQLHNELAKLSAYCGDSAVTDETVRELVKANFEDKMFDFVDAVAQKQQKKALQLLEEQRLSGSTDFHLFAMIARQVRLLLAARLVLDRNPQATKADIASEVSVHPFVAQKLLTQARSFTNSQLKGVHDLLFAFDKKVKRGALDIDISVDRVVGALMQS